MLACVRFGRLIPTCVGSTGTLPLGGLARSAHPHVCGEHNSTPVPEKTGVGSSPRVWGAQTKQRARQALPRLIPTCVGSTCPPHLRCVTRAAHPHVCGEHAARTVNQLNQAGSSPRVWGARTPLCGSPRISRLIPTCVGSTPYTGACAAISPAHPHVCGEHLTPADVAAKNMRLISPRVWGAPGCHAAAGCLWRLIPTCVGSTPATAI